MGSDRRVFSAGFAAKLRQRAGKPYRPSNGTEGDLFESAWCHQCRRFDPADGDPCEIAGRAFLFDLGEPEYPVEWQIGEDGQPCCTAFSDADEPERLRPCEGQQEFEFEGA